MKSLRWLAKEYMAATGRKITPAGITKHYEVRGIPRNLTGKIKAKAESLVNKELVNKKTALTELDIVDANAWSTQHGPA
ncbi:hypothetical protein [Nitrosomonas ureae]|uniref:hypothetical protein n=1 Tax=Nitrosomonas ureae TaxID=44577 RepID=UPI00159641F1|nr:hypothetical protein [Nitrosomonas ureae]